MSRSRQCLQCPCARVRIISIPGVLTNTKKPVGELRARGSSALLLENAVIDTKAAREGNSLSVPEAYAASPETEYYIIQFEGPVSETQRSALEAAGAQVTHYVPNAAYAVRVKPENLIKIQELPGVTFVQPYHPYFKMSRDLLDYVNGAASEASKDRVEQGEFSVLSFRGSELRSTLESAGYEVTAHETINGRAHATVRAPAAQLASLLRQEAVQWVEPSLPRKAMNDLAKRRVAVSALRQMHPTLTGQGVTIGLTDSGIDYKNRAFALDQTQPTTTGSNTRINNYFLREGGVTSDGLPGDNDGHGTHVAGTILGNGANSASVVKAPGSGTAPYGTNQFAGMAPEARIVVIEDFNSFSDAEQAQLTVSSGARISNNSWGNSLYQYGNLSAAWDDLVNDADSNTVGRQQLTAFFAAGNDGGGLDDGSSGVAGTVGQPGNAKNVITVGALEQPRNASNLSGSELETDSDWQISSFSSRGPVTPTDVRFKPDIVAPGSYVLSVQSSETLPDDLIEPFLPHRDYRYGNLNSGTNYAFFSGTSMATPVAVGAAALIQQYYTSSYGAEPTPAMMKAMMVSGARMVNSLRYRFAYDSAFATLVDQGYGMLDVRRSVDGPRIHDTDEVILLDEGQTTPLGTAEVFQRQIQLNAGEGGLKIALAWTDPAGTPGNAFQLVNDLDLILLAPGGGGYLGNQYELEGIHSRKFVTPDPALGDEYNNVEVISLRDAPLGTYTVQVRGYQVGGARQPFALVIMKGTGIEGRAPGDAVDIALDTNDAPVIAYSALDDAGQKQIYVKKWEGPYGDLSELGMWKRLEDQWFGLRYSASKTGISRTLEDSENPSVAVKGDNIFVAWRERPRVIGGTNISHVFFRQYDGADWIELGDSAHGKGIDQSNSMDAFLPQVGVMGDGKPVVSWLQFISPSVINVRVAKWNGTNWVGLANSISNGLSMTFGLTNNVADYLSLAINNLGNPVVAWHETPGVGSQSTISVRRWNGSSWDNLNYSNSLFFIDSPKIAASADNGDLYLVWRQQVTGVSSFWPNQIFAAKWNGTTWTEMAGSYTFPGVSATSNSIAADPIQPDIGVAGLVRGTNVVISWRAGNGSANSIFVKRWTPGLSAWTSFYGAGIAPGIGIWPENAQPPAMVMDKAGLPFIAFPLASTSNESYLATYTVIGDRSPPVFDGLQTAVGGTNGNVQLGWLSATEEVSTNFFYYIYRGTQTFTCGTPPACNEGNVFSNLVAVVTNLTSFSVTGLVPNLVYCFGVRAVNTNSLMDANTVVLSAGPASGAGDNDSDCLANAVEWAIGTEPCVRDTDGDAMWDGWEWTFSTNNLAKTNSISLINTNMVYLDPLDNGFDRVRTIAANDGQPDQLAGADIDSDGASNFEEFQWWLTFGGASCAITNLAVPVGPNPTQADTDGDGIPDGWEIINGLNPINPLDGLGDLDGDGLTNLQESQYGTDPRNADSDGDGLNDGAEVNTHQTDPSLADSDRDGLDDGYEVAIGSDPRRADSNGNYVSDGQMVQLGLSPTGTVGGYRMLLFETFETNSTTRTNWYSNAPNGAFPKNFWHLSAAEPSPNTNGYVYFEDHSSSNSYRAAYDPSATDVNATYTPVDGPQNLIMALYSPLLTTNAVGATNLFIRWREFYQTEPVQDFMVLQVRGGTTNWIQVAAPVSGLSGVTNVGDTNIQARWVTRVLDISQFVNRTNVQVRFLFTANSINNGFRGWWVDDVAIYEAASKIVGWVRDNNGRAIVGSTVRAMGRGGLTNYVAGHRFVLPGEIFLEQRTAGDGSFTLTGLPKGNYYIKASAENYIDEFWDGALFTPPYAFGASLRPGVAARELVSANGVLTLLSSGISSNVHFELERGIGRASLGVTLPNGAGLTYPVMVDGVTNQIWNGSNNTNTAAFTNYLTVNASGLLMNFPDWLTTPTSPTYLSDLAPGPHRPYAVGTNLNLYPLADVDLREGESTLLILATNQASGRLFVNAGDRGSYGLRINGRAVTNRTPAVLSLAAGLHEVSLVATGQTSVLPAQFASIPLGGRADVTFSSINLSAQPGSLRVLSTDVFGQSITGALVYVNGAMLTSNQTIESKITTPVTIKNLGPGDHSIVLQLNGYRGSDYRSVAIYSGVTNETTFTLYQADRDYDRVGDGTEILGYTNLFKFHRDEDPDLDGLNNLLEFDTFRLFNITLNPFDDDSDDDRATDGRELGYDGRTNLFAFSGLFTNASQFGNSVRSLFIGQYLAGIDNFGSGVVTGSIAGDQFVGSISHPLLTVPTAAPALTVFTNIPAFPAVNAISVAHTVDAEIFADGNPGRVDTDGDGLWDGFELNYGPPNLAAMRLIDAGQLTEDLDGDGLANQEEFLGQDRRANTNDWTNPGASDTDGDLMPDGFEYANGLNPLNNADAFLDPDSDGLVNLGEYLSGTSPGLRDTDADYLPDYEEVAIYNTDPNNRDTDADGLADGQEVYDRNGDGIQDGGFFPMWAGGDLDGDSLVDGPTDWDTDGDGMPDGFEVLNNFGLVRPVGLDPYNPTDGDEDADGDGLSNLQEYLVRDALFGNHPSSEPLFLAVWYGRPHDPLTGADYSTAPFAPNYPVWDYSSDPFNADSDGDGMPDGFEVFNGLHPADPISVDSNTLERFSPIAGSGDLDGDGLWNDREYRVRFALDGSADPNAAVSLSTHPWRPDTDNDGLDDGEEHHAMLSSPVVQDTDVDRLMDGTGATGYVGEVESALRRRFELVSCPGCSWLDAQAAAASLTSPDDGVTLGHLAVLGSAREWSEAIELVGGSETNIAIGLQQIIDPLAGPLNNYAPINGEPLNFQFFYTNRPAPAATTTNGVVVGPDGVYRILNVTNTSVDAFLVEWDTVSVVTNHFDEALNDLWQLTFPNDDGLGAPYWTRITPDPVHDLPPARWGHTMNYVPGYEIKNQAGGSEKLGLPTHILLDNRKLVVIGGRDGVDKYGDIWEYWIKSNGWTRSERTLPELANFSFFQKEMASGISEHQSALLMTYKKTSDCIGDDCGEGRSWDCNGIDFGEPKERPWDNGFQKSSYDAMYLLGGWNDEHDYLFKEPMDSLYYKSTDDLNPIVEESRAFDNQGGSADPADAWEAFETRLIRKATTNGYEYTTGVVSRVYGSLTSFGIVDYTETGGFPIGQRLVPMGNFVTFGVVTNQDGDETISSVSATNVATAIRIEKYPFKSPCDNIVKAELIFDIQTPPAGDLALSIIAEFQYGEFNSSDDYSYGLVTPLERAAGSAFVSTSIPFTIPAGTSGLYTTDVTTILQEVSLNASWRGYAVGFVITNDVTETDWALMKENSAFIRISHIPSYRSPATYLKSTTVQTEQGEIPSKRKSHGMVYNYKDNKLIVFGGMNGRQVFDETYEAVPGEGLGQMTWVRVFPPSPPSARWAHSMVYDDVNNRVILFGGFDANNQPLNDLWEYSTSISQVDTTNALGSNITVTVTNDAAWREITDFQDNQRPTPRGGAMMVFYGGNFYDRGAGGEYAISDKRDKVVIFGGTDGKNYFNDLWYYDEAEDNQDIDTNIGNRWVLADPGGQHSPGPAPRAFGQLVFAQNGALTPDLAGLGTYANGGEGTNRGDKATVYLFGGRKGTLPTGKDTDRDLVDDGQEYELGGPAAGRDPRVNALFPDLNTTETIPFTLKRIGTWGGTLPFMQRPPIADMETLSYHERLHGWRMGIQYVGRNLPWQGYPLETTHVGQYYVIGNESVFPVEDPNTNRILYITGVDAYSPDWINMWFHRHGIGDPQDPRDVWQLGRPSNIALGTNGAPPYAYSGRWVYGTSLEGAYPPDAIMELYSPIFDLLLPNGSATDTNNQNSFFLMFHEWVDLADSKDVIRVDAVRPVTPADVATRVSGLNRPAISLVPNRNNTANTRGKWRRSIVPLDILGNQSNLYVRFTLQSDSARQAGGWYIDDVAILQGAEISGTVLSGGTNVDVCLLGENFNEYQQQCTSSTTNGNFSFGLLPLGNYAVSSGGSSSGPIVLAPGNLNATVNFMPPPIFMGIGFGSAIVTWSATNGAAYQLDYSTNLLTGPWTPLYSITSGVNSTLSYTDTPLTDIHRVYRISITNAP
jgi:hypothetical protein